MRWCMWNTLAHLQEQILAQFVSFMHLHMEQVKKMQNKTKQNKKKTFGFELSHMLL